MSSLRALAAILTSLAACGHEHVTGSLDVDAVPLEPRHCTSGDLISLRSVDVTTARGSLVRIADDRQYGRVVRVYRGDETTPYRVWTAAQCAIFRLDMTRSEVRTEGIHPFDAHLAIECSADGHSIRGEIAVARCLRGD